MTDRIVRFAFESPASSAMIVYGTAGRGRGAIRTEGLRARGDGLQQRSHRADARFYRQAATVTLGSLIRWLERLAAHEGCDCRVGIRRET